VPSATLALTIFGPLGLTLLAAICDARGGKIPNRLTLPTLLLAPLAHGLTAGPGASGASLLGALLAGLPPLLVFMRGGMGGGDVKLFAALGALMGLGPALETQLLAYILGGLFGLLLLWRHGQLGPALMRCRRAAATLLGVRRASDDAPGAAEPGGIEVRLGPAIFVATVLSTVGATPWGLP